MRGRSGPTGCSSRGSEGDTEAATGFDLIIDTVPSKHDLKPYLPLLDDGGTLAPDIQYHRQLACDGRNAEWLEHITDVQQYGLDT